MKTKIAALAAGLLLAATASIALPATPAEAHDYDGNSAWFCALTRPNGWTMNHSWPYGMSNGVVVYKCRAGYFGTNDVQWFVEWNQNTNPDTVTRLGGYQRCNPGGITWCVH